MFTKTKKKKNCTGATEKGGRKKPPTGPRLGSGGGTDRGGERGKRWVESKQVQMTTEGRRARYSLSADAGKKAVAKEIEKFDNEGGTKGQDKIPKAKI